MIDWQDAFFDGDSPEKGQYDSLWEDWRCRSDKHFALIHRIGRRDLPRPTAETTALLSSFYGQWRSSDEQLDELPEGSR
jgi:hypothetical protein